MQSYFETDYFTIGYDKGNHLLINKWKVAPTSAEFREGMNSLIAAMEHFKAGKIVSDTTHLGTIHPNDQQWSATDWIQRALKVGYLKTAIIVPADIFTQMSVEDTLDQVDNPPPFIYCGSLEDAIDWIKQA